MACGPRVLVPGRPRPLSSAIHLVRSPRELGVTGVTPWPFQGLGAGAFLHLHINAGKAALRVAFELRRQVSWSWWGHSVGGAVPLTGLRRGWQGWPGMKHGPGVPGRPSGVQGCVQAQLASLLACRPARSLGRLSFVRGERAGPFLKHEVQRRQQSCPAMGP